MNSPPEKRRVAFSLMNHLMNVLDKIIKFSILNKLKKVQQVKCYFSIRIKIIRQDMRYVV
jgi:hypothetical protein